MVPWLRHSNQWMLEYIHGVGKQGLGRNLSIAADFVTMHGDIAKQRGRFS
jgi:hypothetical protein